ncbi:MAG: BrnT family toxin [Alphaproteobacteria bacterium]|nr:BrnT family toxin [Alphaproteobacteria bacterium]
MKFEWHEAMRLRNLAKHDMDFADVVALDWERATVVEDARQDYGESRYRVFASLNGRLCAVTIAIRANAIRIISLRKANKREGRRYGQATS